MEWRKIDVPLVCPRCGAKVRLKATVKSALPDETVALDYASAMGCGLCPSGDLPDLADHSFSGDALIDAVVSERL